MLTINEINYEKKKNKTALNLMRTVHYKPGDLVVELLHEVQRLKVDFGSETLFELVPKG